MQSTRPRQVFYKYMTARVTKIALTTRRLRWSSPLLFNDPFDVTQELRLNFDQHELNAAVTERVASLMERGDSPAVVKHPVLGLMLRHAVDASPDDRRAMADEFRRRAGAATLGPGEALKELKDIWSAIVPTFRILCLSERHDVVPMWNHYADGYKGVVLQLLAVKEVDSAFLVARPVMYQDAPPSIADANAWVSCMLGHGEKGYHDLWLDYLCVKNCEWSYEREWRIAAPGRRPDDNELFGDYGFDPRELTAIYFGPKCSEEDREDLLKLLAYGLEHIQAHDMIPDIQHARLVSRGTVR